MDGGPREHVALERERAIGKTGKPALGLVPVGMEPIPQYKCLDKNIQVAHRRLPSCWATGWLTPRLVKRFGSLARVRRGLGSAGCALACLMLLFAAHLKHPLLAMAAMGCSCLGNDMAMPGSWAGCMDLGGRFAGTLSGLMNTWGCIGGLLAPWTIPYILQAADNQWPVVIQVIAGWYFVGALCWLGIDPVTPLDRLERAADG